MFNIRNLFWLHLSKTCYKTTETAKQHKNWKSIKNVKKSEKKLKIVWEWFLGRNIKTHFFWRKIVFLTKIFPKRFNVSLNLLPKNDKYGPTIQKLKIGQKRQKLFKQSENSLERVFMTKQQNKIFWQKELFFDQNCPKTLEIIENLFRNDKTAKQHKNWKLVKTVKNW